mmetsp:Transcript_1923/g.4108  ORF Transcript_1923/g.4108 Transcript_1923/m.4108 type:complete len:328 (+) Transcript_1923:130-1113(+)
MDSPPQQKNYRPAIDNPTDMRFCIYLHSGSCCGLRPPVQRPPELLSRPHARPSGRASRLDRLPIRGGARRERLQQRERVVDARVPARARRRRANLGRVRREAVDERDRRRAVGRKHEGRPLAAAARERHGVDKAGVRAERAAVAIGVGVVGSEVPGVAVQGPGVRARRPRVAVKERVEYAVPVAPQEGVLRQDDAMRQVSCSHPVARRVAPVRRRQHVDVAAPVVAVEGEQRAVGENVRRDVGIARHVGHEDRLAPLAVQVGHVAHVRRLRPSVVAVARQRARAVAVAGARRRMRQLVVVGIVREVADKRAASRRTRAARLVREDAE